VKSDVCLVLLAATLLAACSGSALPEPTVADANRGSAHFPDLTLSELQQGRKLYLSRCGSCHTLKRPAELPPEQWQEEVSEMRTKNGVKLSDTEAQAIVRYLAVAATAG
jgi:mono/diheme cytochrome c family protein